MKNTIRLFCTLVLSHAACTVYAQQITGVWKGKISNQKVELKIIQKGDSLTGTSYYYSSASNYRRYTIKGYFDQENNSVVWWDDQLIKDNGSSSGKNGLLSVADFNCPGGGEMHLDGKTSTKENDPKGSVSLTKVGGPSFTDEWDFVIDNYTVGANDPDIIDSVGLIASTPVKKPITIPEIKQPAPEVVTKTKPVQKTEPLPKPAKQIETAPLTIEEKFTTRTKVFMKEIPIEGDSIELRFYDNAQIDGDSISLFLNDKILFTHVRLTDKAYTIKLPVKELSESNELIMVAENLGSIPPNTSYMVAIVGDKRYDAKLASTENSSAMIRLKKMERR
jgi:hypothetical protein